MTPPITIHDRVILDEPIDEAWNHLTDPQTVISCVPGAEILSLDDDGTLRGAISISLGPTTTRFAGRATLQFDSAEHTGRIRGQGADGPGRTRAIIESSFTVTPDEASPARSALTIDSTVTVSGALAPFAATGGKAVAGRLLRDFAENLGRLGPSTDTDADTAGENSGPTTPAGHPISVIGLLLRALRDSLSRLFRRRSTPPSDQGECP